MTYLAYSLIGFVAGILSGMFGIGGGVLIVPALVLALGFDQHRAQGTSLAVFLVPVGALAAFNYYKKGSVDFAAAAAIAVCLFCGGFFGSKIALALPEQTIRKVFACFLVLVAIQLFFKK
ncbi:MAG: sulfite exporter TauE/SafE family protein [Armatimonadetes bacterium]|nr:sulfite exporter TauE/SafE family protein [Armatimonadota bacterium]